ncbi:activated protein kinase catalytic subunit alpha-1 [Seminavis robusta]|uniref:guanylate cyclase n=1 Tax=Seminavis robusta TaxID=568900 RepID=A0A9N8EPC4_9STRA|nr:activated protein kinase catalytic subunit alpha-1 [Seminavis robusta]|eukprot:Sro1484_g276450.1 activated protein kinase catalytic subunit alpha-1 (1290) ;mRNA; f:9075-14561
MMKCPAAMTARILSVVLCLVPLVLGQDDHWPQGQLNCAHGFRQFDPLTQKKIYRVGVHAPNGLETARKEFNLTFETYLTHAVGRRWIPPIEFKMVPTMDPLRDWVDKNADVDFMYSDTGLYSCIGTEIGGQPLGTTISHLTARGRSYNLDMLGGVILTRAENKAINSIKDIKNKIIAAVSISDFAGGQVQFYAMYESNLNYIMDPKQVIFTDNEDEIVKGVLDGRWDVGFVRTGQVERTRDINGTFLDPNLFKVIEPKIYVMDTGDLFPFLHSTPVFPEWPLFAKQNVDRMVSEEVAVALINFEYHKVVGDAIHDCREAFCNTMIDPNCTVPDRTICDTAPPVYFDPTARCDTTRELAEMAYQAGVAGRHNGFRPARSHFELRTMQQSAGFLRENEHGDWQCSRASTLYEGIVCPHGYYKVKERDFLKQCSQSGLPCGSGHQCYCRPCVKAYEVDVMQWHNGTIHQAGCDKMSLCASVEQTRVATFRAYDNLERDGARFTAFMHVGHESKPLDVRNATGTNSSYAYEFEFTHDEVGIAVLEVFANEEQIPESPFRVQIVPRNCEADFPGQRKVSTTVGDCECGSGHVEINGDCMPTTILAIIISSVGLVIACELLYCYLGYRKAKSDEVWQVNTEELHFSQPPEVVGQGAFGVVLLAEYRGTKVAIKRILPNRQPNVAKAKGSKGNLSIESLAAGKISSNSEDSGDIEAPHDNASNSMDPNTDSVGFSRSDDDEDETDSDLDFLGRLSAGRRRSKWAKWFPWLDPNGEARYNASILGSASGSHNSSSTKTVVAFFCPWLDEHARRKHEFELEMRLLSRLRHPCITTVMGAVMSRGCEPMMVMEYMENGSLYDLLRNDTMYTGGEVIMQICRDVAQGLRFLHASKPPIMHGDMKAKNILIDSRFRAKVADFGLSTKKKNGLSGTPFWMAPEYLRGKSEYNPSCDIYSFGIIMYEIYGRKDPYGGEHPRKVLRKICDPRVNKRPPVPNTCPVKMADIMQKCWSPDPFFRPTAKDLDILFLDMAPREAEPVIEETARVRTQVATGDMLYQVFPRKVADKLKAGQKVEPETHPTVTVFFSDIVHFTDISRMLSPVKVCAMLDRLYLAFDKLATTHNVFKVETIGDAWMGVTNLENNQDDSHVKQIAEFAIAAVKASGRVLIDEDDPKKGFVRIRAGFHSGPVVSNVIGSLNPRYGLFGDTVNTASRMESNSYSGKIHCSDASAALLKDQAPEIPLIRRGKIAVKGKGQMTTYWVAEGLTKENKKSDDDDTEIETLFQDDHPTVAFKDDVAYAT